MYFDDILIVWWLIFHRDSWYISEVGAGWTRRKRREIAQGLGTLCISHANCSTLSDTILPKVFPEMLLVKLPKLPYTFLYRMSRIREDTQPKTIQSTLRKRRWFLYLAHLRWLIRWFCWVPNCYNRHYWNTMVPAIENTKADFLSGGAALAFTGAGISKDSDGLMMTSFKIFVAVCKSLQDIHIYCIYIYIWTYIYIFIYIRNVLYYYTIYVH